MLLATALNVFMVFILVLNLRVAKWSPLPMFLMIGLLLQFSFPLSFFASSGVYSSRFFNDPYALLWAVVLVVIFAVLVIIGSRLGDRSNEAARERDSAPIYLILLFAASIVGAVAMVSSAVTQVFSERLLARAGDGYLFIFGYAGLVYCFSLALRSRRSWRGCLENFALALPTILFFLAAGHRSVVFIVLLAVGSGVWLPFLKKTHLRFAIIVALAIGAINPLNYWTGAVRSVYAQTGELDGALIRDRAYEISARRPIPMANSHLELIAGYLEKTSLYDLLVGNYATIGASLSNWVPRAMVQSKGQTTGPYFASIYFPEWFIGGRHASSLTTGIFLDLIFNFGLALAPFLIVVIYFFTGKVVSVLRKSNTEYAGAFGLYIAWTVGFNAYFDDLGGVINKLVIGVFIFVVILILQIFIRPQKLSRIYARGT